VQDPEIFGTIMKQLKRSSSKSEKDFSRFDAVLSASSSDTDEYAHSIISLAESEFGVKSLFQPKDLARCRSARLLMGFTAQLFAANNGLEDFESVVGGDQALSAAPPPSDSMKSAVDLIDSGSVPIEGKQIPPSETDEKGDTTSDPGKIANGNKRRGKKSGADGLSFSGSVQTPVKRLPEPMNISKINGDGASACDSTAAASGTSNCLPLLSPSPMLTDTYKEHDDLERTSLQGELMLEDLRTNNGDLRRSSIEPSSSSGRKVTKSLAAASVSSGISSSTYNCSQNGVTRNGKSPSSGVAADSVLARQNVNLNDVSEDSRPDDDDDGIPARWGTDAASSVAVTNGYISGISTTCEATEQAPSRLFRQSVPVIRLLQYRPAWELHILLRLFKLPYVCENVNNSTSTGVDLPVLCVGGDIVPSQYAAEYLKAKFGTAIDAGLDPLGPRRYSGTTTDEKLLCSFIRTELINPLRVLLSSSGDEAAQVLRCRRYDPGAHISALWRFEHLRNYFSNRR
jgi:hypothetical protein